jgi:hypothetical protein
MYLDVFHQPKDMIERKAMKKSTLNFAILRQKIYVLADIIKRLDWIIFPGTSLPHYSKIMLIFFRGTANSRLTLAKYRYFAVLLRLGHWPT